MFKKIKAHWKDLLLLGILACAWAVALNDLLIPGLFTSHDGEAHVLRLVQFHQALNDGQFPPMWGNHFFSNMGSPVMMLNYQLPYFVADMVYRVSQLTYIGSFKFTLGLSYVASGLAAYISFRRIFRSRLAGFLSAMIYTWAPYRFVDLYVRAAFGENVSFIFYPLIFLAIFEESLLLGALSFAGLFLSHQVGSALFMPICFGYCLLLALQRRKPSLLLRTVIMFIIGFGIASFNLIPTLAYTHLTHFSTLTYIPLQHFPTFRQLLYSPWGYGVSVLGDQDHMSFQLGAGQWSSIIITFGFLVFQFKKILQDKQYQAALMMWSLFGCLLFLMLPISTPIWNIALDQIIDFPWRILLVITFITAYLMSWWIPKIPAWSRVGVVLFFTCLVMYANRNHIHINKVWDWGDNYYIQGTGTGDANGEYAPIFRVTTNTATVPSRIEFVEGGGQIKMEQDRTNLVAAAIQATDATPSSVIRINTMYFPGWRLFLDDQRERIRFDHDTCQITEKLDRTVDLTGLIICRITPGNHSLRLVYQAPAYQRLGNMVTLASLLLVLCLIFLSFCPPTMKRKVFLRLSQHWPKFFNRQKKHLKSSS